MKIMATHSSAIARAATPHATYTEHNSSKDNACKASSSQDNASEDNARKDNASEAKARNEKIAALAEKIFAAGEEATAALFVLMGALQYSPDPAADTHAVKHLAFTRC